MEPLLLQVVGALLVVVGIVGTVLPVLPGPLLVFGGLLLIAWADGFAHVGAVGLSIVGALALVAWGLDLAATALGARRVGASPQALVGATLGGALGLFFGLPGLVAGPFVGAVAGELLARRGIVQAGKAGLATWLGLVAAAVAKLVLAFLMVAVFLAFYLLSGPAGP